MFSIFHEIKPFYISYCISKHPFLILYLVHFLEFVYIIIICDLHIILEI